MSPLGLLRDGKMRTHHARFGVPEKVGPVGVSLHLAKDEEFAQAEINHPRRDLRVPR